MSNIILAKHTKNVVTLRSSIHVEEIRSFVGAASPRAVGVVLDHFSIEEQAFALNAVGFEKRDGRFQYFVPGGGSCLHLVKTADMLVALLQRGADHGSKNAAGETLLELVQQGKIPAGKDELERMVAILRPLAINQLREETIFEDARRFGISSEP